MSLFGDVTHCRKTLCEALQTLLIGVDPMTQNNERKPKQNLKRKDPLLRN